MVPQKNILISLLFLIQILLFNLFPPNELHAQPVTKQLYLSETQNLDRIDPVATADATTETTYTLESGIQTIIINNKSTGYSSNPQSATFSVSHTTGTGENRLMLVGISQKNKSVLSVSYAGKTLTKVGENISNNNARVYIYSLINPPEGTADVIVNLDANPDKGIAVGVVTFNGVNQSAPLGTFSSQSGKYQYPTVTVPSSTGDLVFDVVTVRNRILQSAGPGQVVQWNINTGGEIKGAGASVKQGEISSTTTDWLLDNAEDCAIGAVAIKPAPREPQVTFLQNQPICSPFQLVVGSTIESNLYINQKTGSTTGSSNITAVLGYGSTTVANLTNAGFSGGVLILRGNVLESSVPAGTSLELTVYNNDEASTTFSIDYDSQTAPSHINMVTTTFINIDNFKLYNASYPGGSIINDIGNKTTGYLCIEASDPFGGYDITSTDISITDPFSGITNVTLTDDDVTGTFACGKIYQLAWTPSGVGNYTINATAYEGYEGVTASESLSVNVNTWIDANDDLGIFIFNTPLNIDVLINDAGDTDKTKVTVETQPSNGTATADPLTGTIKYTPNPGFSGDDSFTYQVCSSFDDAVCDIATVSLSDCDATPSENKIGGYVFLEVKPDNGAYDFGESLQEGITVNLYADSDCDGFLDAGEKTPIQTTTSDQTGRYSFSVNSTGCYITKLDLSDQNNEYTTSELSAGTANFPAPGTCNNVQDLGMLATADLEITNTVSDSRVKESDIITYTITVKNNGPDGATNVLVTDILPINFSHQSHSASQGTYNYTTGKWNVGSIAVGASKTLAVTGKVITGGFFSNTAVAEADEPDLVKDNNSASVSVSALKTFGPGASIISLNSPTVNGGLKPYGLLFHLVNEHQIPVYWAINPDKSFVNQANKTDQVDFTADGIGYKSGAFIISPEFADLPEVKQAVNEWKSMYPGLTVNRNTTAFDAPINGLISSFPRAVLDQQNGDKIQNAFYVQASIPNTQTGFDLNGNPLYDLYRPDGMPSNLGPCDDIYAMPHADPQDWNQQEKEILLQFVKNGGWLWAACHAVSAIEALVDVDNDGINDMNFLSNTGLIPWGDHDDASVPFYYSTGQGFYTNKTASDPFMQFIGKLGDAFSGGSEQVFLPDENGWRNTTTIAVWDPDQIDVIKGNSPGEAVLVAYGRAYGNPDYGMVLYEASHTIQHGSDAENTAAARIYGNFWLQAGLSFSPVILAETFDNEVYSGGTIPLSVDATVRSGPPVYQWSSSCGGTFTNPNGPSTDFIAPDVDDTTTCVIRLEVVDQCNRNNFVASVVTIYPQADIAISKSVTPNPVIAGESTQYTISIINNGPSLAQDVEVNDLLPSGLTLENAVPAKGTWSSPMWQVGDLASGETATLTLTAKVDPSFADNSNINNTATVSSATFDPNSSNNSASATNVVNTEVDLELIKTALSDTILAGTTATYKLEVVNHGPSDAQDVLVTDDFSSISSFLSDIKYSTTNGDTWSSLPSPYEYAFGTLPSGYFRSILVRGNVNPTSVNGSNFDNTATVTTSTTETNSGNNTSTVTNIIKVEADLRIEKDFVEVQPGAHGRALIVSAVTVTNLGPGAANGVTLEDSPVYSSDSDYKLGGITESSLDGVSWSTYTGGPPFKSKLNYPFGPNETITMYFRTETNTGSGKKEYTNTATTYSDDSDPVSDNNTVTIDITPAIQVDLSIKKSASPDPVLAGEMINYMLVVSNDPNYQTALDVSVLDFLSSEYLEAGAATYSINGVQQGHWKGTVKIDTLVNGTSDTILISVPVKSSAPSNAKIDNTARVSSGATDVDPSNNSSKITTKVNTEADIAVSKSVYSPNPVVAGQQIVYEITATNSGPSDAKSANITDVIPGDIDNVEFSYDNSSWSNWPGNNKVSFGSLIPGTSETVFVRGDLAAEACGSILNQVSISSGTIDPDNSNNSFSLTSLLTDTEAPKIFCNDDILVFSNELSCDANVSIVPPVATDFCDNNVDISYVRDDGLLLTDPYPGGITTITWTATDDLNNSSSCNQKVTVKDNVAPVINTCAPDRNLFIDPINCNVVVPDLSAEIFANDNCTQQANLLITQTPEAGSFITENTNVVVTVSDEYGNAAECHTFLTLADSVAPLIACPENVFADSRLNFCDAYINPGLPVVSDNCGLVEYINDYVGEEQANDYYPVGTTIITWTATDDYGNTSACQQEVTVTDNEAPLVNCPSDISVVNDPGVCGATVMLPDPDYSDNCSVESVVWEMSGSTDGNSAATGINSIGGQTLNSGSTTVTFTIKDSSGNPTVCFYKVVVEDCSNLVTVKSLANGSNSNPDEGESVSFTITVYNNGPDDAANVQLLDKLPSGISYSASNVSQGNYDSSTGMWSIGNLLSGSSADMELTGIVDEGQGGNTITNNTTAAIGESSDPTAAGDDLEESIIVNDTPVASDDSDTTDEDTPLNGDVSSNDTPSADGGKYLVGCCKSCTRNIGFQQ